MNKNRRFTLYVQIHKLEDLESDLSTILERLNEICAEEEDSADSLRDSPQFEYRIEEMEDNCEKLQKCEEKLECVIEEINSIIEDLKDVSS